MDTVAGARNCRGCTRNINTRFQCACKNATPTISKARVPVLRGGCVAARGCIMRPGYRLCLTEIGMRPGRCRWLALVQGPHAGMRSLGDDCRGRSRRGSRAQGAHKASQARAWVCRAYVQMACRLLGTSNRRTMHGIRYPGQVLKEEGEGG